MPKQRNTRRFVKRCLISVLLIMVVVVGARVVIGRIVDYRVRGHGEHIAERIERFKQQHGRLPNPDIIPEMQAVGFELRIDWHPAFLALNYTDYELWFYHGFDDPHKVYSSRTKTWREEPG